MDSDNILSILASLGNSPQAGAMPTNVMQTLASGAPVNVDQGSIAPPQQQIDPASIAQAATAASPPPPRKRVSLVEVIGHLADGLAQAGGATPMYQKTMDAMQANQFAGQDHAREVDLDALKKSLMEQQLATGQTTAADSERSRFASVLDAVSDPQDAANLPQLMAAAGLTDQRYAPFVKMVQDNPETAKVLSGALGGGKDDKAKYLGITQVIRNKATGEVQVLQPSADGSPARNLIPPGWEYVDTFKPVDLGGTTGMTATHSATPSVILPKTARPDTVLSTATQKDIARRNNQTQITIAGMPARGKASDSGDPYTNYANGVSSIRALDQSLNDLATDPRLAGATGLVDGRLNITAAQRAIKGKIDSLVGQGIPAAIAAIKASGGAAPRSVAEIMGEVKGLQGAIQNRDMATPDYIANVTAARNRLRQRLNDMTSEAIRQGYVIQDSNGNIVPAPKKAPANNGWSVVGVK